MLDAADCSGCRTDRDGGSQSGTVRLGGASRRAGRAAVWLGLAVLMFLLFPLAFTNPGKADFGAWIWERLDQRATPEERAAQARAAAVDSMHHPEIQRKFL